MDNEFDDEIEYSEPDEHPEPCPMCGADLATRVTSGFDDEWLIETYCTECDYSTFDIG